MNHYTVHIEKLYTVAADSPEQAIQVAEGLHKTGDADQTNTFVTDEMGEEVTGNAGCDSCGVADRAPGSKLCAHCGEPNE